MEIPTEIVLEVLMAADYLGLDSMSTPIFETEPPADMLQSKLELTCGASCVCEDVQATSRQILGT